VDDRQSLKNYQKRVETLEKKMLARELYLKDIENMNISLLKMSKTSSAEVPMSQDDITLGKKTMPDFEVDTLKQENEYLRKQLIKFRS